MALDRSKHPGWVFWFKGWVDLAQYVKSVGT